MFFKNANTSFKFLSVSLIITLVGSFILMDLLKVKHVDATMDSLPSATELLDLSGMYQMPLLKGIKLDPNNPLLIDFIVSHDNQNEIDKKESSKLVNYFLAALTVPQKDFWVNLSPYEKDRVIEDKLGITDLGRDMLGQDYVLKQLMSSLTYPEKGVGKEYWEKLNSRLYEDHGDLQGSVETFNKVWIVPGNVEVYEYQTSAVINDAQLKVMLEEDYLAKSKSKVKVDSNIKELSVKNLREIIIPRIEDDVNYGQNFAPLRQLYNSLILALWFKQKFAQSFYANYIDQAKINGIDIDDKEAKSKIFARYKEAFEKGVYNYIKKEVIPNSNKTIKRHYFSGGENFGPDVLDISSSIKQVSVNQLQETALEFVSGSSSMLRIALDGFARATARTLRSRITSVVLPIMLSLAMFKPAISNELNDIQVKLSAGSIKVGSLEQDQSLFSAKGKLSTQEMYTATLKAIETADLDKVIKNIRKDLESNPNSSELWNLYANACFEKSKTQNFGYWMWMGKLAGAGVQLGNFERFGEFPDGYRSVPLKSLSDVLAIANELREEQKKTNLDIYTLITKRMSEEADYQNSSKDMGFASDSLSDDSDGDTGKSYEEQIKSEEALSFLNDTLPVLEEEIDDIKSLLPENKQIMDQIYAIRMQLNNDNVDIELVKNDYQVLESYLGGLNSIVQIVDGIQKHVMVTSADSYAVPKIIYEIEELENSIKEKELELSNPKEEKKNQKPIYFFDEATGQQIELKTFEFKTPKFDSPMKDMLFNYSSNSSALTRKIVYGLLAASMLTLSVLSLDVLDGLKGYFNNVSALQSERGLASELYQALKDDKTLPVHGLSLEAVIRSVDVSDAFQTEFKELDSMAQELGLNASDNRIIALEGYDPNAALILPEMGITILSLDHFRDGADYKQILDLYAHELQHEQDLAIEPDMPMLTLEANGYAVSYQANLKIHGSDHIYTKMSKLQADAFAMMRDNSDELMELLNSKHGSNYKYADLQYNTAYNLNGDKMSILTSGLFSMIDNKFLGFVKLNTETGQISHSDDHVEIISERIVNGEAPDGVVFSYFNMLIDENANMIARFESAQGDVDFFVTENNKGKLEFEPIVRSSSSSISSQELKREYGQVDQIDMHYDEHGHLFDKHVHRSRLGEFAEEVVVVDWNKDKNLIKIYELLKNESGIKDFVYLNADQKSEVLDNVFKIIKAGVEYTKEAFKSRNGEYVLLGETANTGGVCKHMGLMAGVFLRKLIEEGYLSGSVYYVRGIGHGWALYRSSQGEFRVFDVAQDQMTSVNDTYQSPAGRQQYSFSTPRSANRYEYKKILTGAQTNFDLSKLHGLAMHSMKLKEDINNLKKRIKDLISPEKNEDSGLVDTVAVDLFQDFSSRSASDPSIVSPVRVDAFKRREIKKQSTVMEAVYDENGAVVGVRAKKGSSSLNTGGIDMAQIDINISGNGLPIAFTKAPFNMNSFSGFVFTIVNNKKLKSSDEVIAFFM